MARAIEIRYCKHCGQLESMHSMIDEEKARNIIEVGCPCGAQPSRLVELGITEAYYLDVEVKMEEAEQHDDSDSGDV